MIPTEDELRAQAAQVWDTMGPLERLTISLRAACDGFLDVGVTAAAAWYLVDHADSIEKAARQMIEHAKELRDCAGGLYEDHRYRAGQQAAA